MLAGQPDPGMAAEALKDRGVVPCDDVPLLGQRWVGQTVTGAQEVDHLADKPWPTIAAAADHQPVCAGAPQRFGSILLGHYVTIGDKREVHRLSDTTDELPVSRAGIKLLAR